MDSATGPVPTYGVVPSSEHHRLFFYYQKETTAVRLRWIQHFKIGLNLQYGPYLRFGIEPSSTILKKLYKQVIVKDRNEMPQIMSREVEAKKFGVIIKPQKYIFY